MHQIRGKNQPLFALRGGGEQKTLYLCSDPKTNYNLDLYMLESLNLQLWRDTESLLLLLLLLTCSTLQDRLT